MNNKIAYICAFSVGAAIGAVVTWKVVKTKYEQIAQEEIDSVKETYSKREKDNIELLEKTSEELKRAVNVTSVEKPDIKEYAAMLENIGYTPAEEKVVNGKEPYVIPPEDFDEYDNYDVVSLTYYADGVLAADNGLVIDDLEGTVGVDFATHFGEYEDDAVYIRNEELSCDYEILKSLENYYISPDAPADIYQDYE